MFFYTFFTKNTGRNNINIQKCELSEKKIEKLGKCDRIKLA